MDLGSYIGIPFRPMGRDRSGIDCYGLVRLYLAEQYGIELADHDYDQEDRSQCACAVSGARESGDWVSTDSPHAGDVVMIRLMGLPMHCAVYIGGGLMLHASHRTGTCIERLASPMWSSRVLGYYRHRDLCHG